MALQWVCDLVSRFVRSLLGTQDRPRSSNNAHQQTDVDLFDNEFRRAASEQAEQAKNCYSNAERARSSGDHVRAQDYLNQVLFLCVWDLVLPASWFFTGGE